MAATMTAPTLHRFTRDEYYRMGEAGLFRNERVELLEGEIITMSPHDPPHAGITSRLAFVLIQLLGANFSVRIQSPIVFNDLSEPEPDIALCELDPDDYEREHPWANQVLLAIEVADSSLSYDRNQKVVAYASSGIREYWIINLVDRRIEVLNNPDPAGQRYQNEFHVEAGDSPSLPGGLVIAAADILPRY
jgi:Uma2 family endonuclease